MVAAGHLFGFWIGVGQFAADALRRFVIGCCVRVGGVCRVGGISCLGVRCSGVFLGVVVCGGDGIAGGVGGAGCSGGVAVGDGVSDEVGEVEKAMRHQLVGDVDPGVDPAGADASGVSGGACGAGREEVAELVDLHRSVGGEVGAQGGHGVGLGPQGEVPAGGGGAVPVLGSVGVDDDHRLTGEFAEFAG